MKIKIYNIAVWEIESEFNDDISNRISNLIHSLIELLEILRDSNLFIPVSYLFEGKQNFISFESFFSTHYWLNFFYSNQKPLSFKILGGSIFYENHELTFDDGIFELNIYAFFDIKNGFEAQLSLKADNFLPYNIINKAKINNDYEINQKKLKKLFTDISKKHMLTFDEENSIALFDGFKLKVPVYDNEVFIYGVNGERYGWVKI